jgi:hypothetical protein
MSLIESGVDGTPAFKAFGAPSQFRGEGRTYRTGSQRGPRLSDIHAKPNFQWTAPLARQASDKVFSSASNNDSADEELLKRRDLLVHVGRKNPTVRLAAFLVAIVHLNPDSGSGGLVISEKTDSLFVADLLGFSMDELVKHLLQFKSQGLITPLSNGSLRITNLAALERLADGHALPASPHASEDEFEVHRVIVEPPRVYTRSTAEAVSLSQFDNAVRFDVVSLTSAACLVVALAVAFGIVGL